MAIGFKIHPRTRTVDPATVEKFKGIAVANISDSMNRMSHGGARIRPLHAGGVLSGVALTVRVRPGDNLMIHAALNRAKPALLLQSHQEGFTEANHECTNYAALSGHGLAPPWTCSHPSQRLQRHPRTPDEVCRSGV